MNHRLWLRQVRGVLRLELRKALFSRRAFPLYLLSIMPVALVLLFVVLQKLFGAEREMAGLSRGSEMYAFLYELGILRVLLFLAAVWTFMNLFRGEILDRCLHYYFLSPIRREVLVAGKYLAGWVAMTIVFVGCTVTCMVILYSYYGVSTMFGYLFAGAGFGQMIGYVWVTVLACLGYGAVFLVVGLFFRNPIIPTVIIWLWEWANPFLPALLKKISVIFYLTSLLPARPPSGAFAVLADPVSAWLAVPGFILVTAATLVVAGLRIRHMEISYDLD